MDFSKKVALRALAVVVAAAALASLANPTFALLVRPIVLDIDSSGRGANGQIEVINDRNRPMAVEIKVSSFTLPEQGELIMGEDAARDFVVFPAIAKLPAGGRQVFRIRYVGEPAPARSKLYMFASSELPVTEAGTTDGAKIEVLYSISTMVAVRAPKTKAAINVIDVQRAKGVNDEPGLRILFQNDGPSHGYVGNAVMDLTSGSWKASLDPSATSKAFGLGLIPAQGRRSLFVPLADVPDDGKIAAELKSAPQA